jgi:hypothetical protein
VESPPKVSVRPVCVEEAKEGFVVIANTPVPDSSERSPDSPAEVEKMGE